MWVQINPGFYMPHLQQYIIVGLGIKTFILCESCIRSTAFSNGLSDGDKLLLIKRVQPNDKRFTE